ncbi:MAG TPA: DUF1080 domain-containing protein [Tepidisphaeraceae bacterium]|nr:DUF1080 domain-containing protein [Tepidisphaeraceae bacterium]
MGWFRGRVGKSFLVGIGIAAGAMFVLAAQEAGQRWKAHDMKRPRPDVITPGQFATADQASKPPSDAIVLLGNGPDDLEKNWDGGPWTFDNGVYVSAGRDITTKKDFGDCQLHVEWAEPTPAHGSSQGRGNSGVIFFGKYEIQVLDSYRNDTYPDGSCAALYGEYPPLVNCCRPPGEFQTYDIVYRAPLFDDQHNPTRPGRVTVFQNGVLVQDNARITGDTGTANGTFTYFQPTGHLELQFHGNKVRYRQVWIRPLGPEALPAETGKE